MSDRNTKCDLYLIVRNCLQKKKIQNRLFWYSTYILEGNSKQLEFSITKIVRICKVNVV